MRLARSSGCGDRIGGTVGDKRAAVEIRRRRKPITAGAGAPPFLLGFAARLYDDSAGAVETTRKPILFLIDELEVGGAQRQILLLSVALRRAGHPVTVAYFQDHNA